MDISNSTNSLARTGVIKSEIVDDKGSHVDFEYITIKKEPDEGCFVIQTDSVPAVEENVSSVFPDTKKKKLPLPTVNPGFCSLCNSAFPSRDDYERHQNTVHSVQRPYQCRFCDKRFKQSCQRKVHETIHDVSRFSRPAQFKCDLCDKSYHLKVSLGSHRRLVHQGYKKPRRFMASNRIIIQHHSTKGVRNPNPNIHRSKQGPQPCPHCDRVLENKSQLRKHLTAHSDTREFACEQCDMSFKTASSLRTHIERIHELGLTPTNRRPRKSASEPRVCTKCGKSYKTWNQLSRHMLIHTGELPYKCNDCGKAFRLREVCEDHRRKFHLPPDPTGLRSYSCRICGISAIRRLSVLINHLKVSHKVVISRNGTHSDTEMFKPFACGVCGRPHHLGINAAICALLCHEPSNILKKMFRYKCPNCPDLFGFCDFFNFRKHWESCHPHLPAPKNFKGRFELNTKISELPTASYDKKRANELRHGVDIPQEVKDSQFPLFVKRDLLNGYGEKETQTGNRKWTKARVENLKHLYTEVKTPDFQRVPKPKRYLRCNRCATEVTRYNFPRHAKRCAQRTEEGTSFECQKCFRIFQKLCALKAHVRKCSSENTRIKLKTVKVCDREGVKKLLNYQFVTVSLRRL